MNVARESYQPPAHVECPSCGRAIEPVEVCYYCCTATSPKRRVSERVLMLGTVPVFLLGAVLLVLAAASVTPVTPIANLAAKGAFLHFRVKGEVVKTYYARSPYTESDVYSVWLDDRSGKTEKESMLKVKIEGPLYQQLKEAGRVPEQGDRLDVEGTLYAGDGFRLLSLNTASMLRIEQPEGK